MKKSKIVIIQPDVREYREKLYIELSKKYDIKIIHAGDKKFKSKHNIIEKSIKTIKILNIKYILSIEREINEAEAIITIFDPHWVNCFFLPLITSKPTILWGHGTGQSNIVNILREKVAKKSKSIIVYDRNGKINLVKYGVQSNKIFIANNTIYVKNKNNYSNNNKNSILYVGRLQKRKELDALIKIYAKICNKIPKNTYLMIIGDGSIIRERLIKLSQELGISHKVKIICGTTDHKVLANHFKNAYCYASPGPVGLGVLHSFAYGVPVITFKNRKHGPEIYNIRHDYNGLLISGGYDDFGRSIIKLIKNGTYKSMGDNAFMYYKKNRQISNMVEGFDNAIKYAINK